MISAAIAPFPSGHADASPLHHCVAAVRASSIHPTDRETKTPRRASDRGSKQHLL